MALQLQTLHTLSLRGMLSYLPVSKQHKRMCCDTGVTYAALSYRIMKVWVGVLIGRSKWLQF